MQITEALTFDDVLLVPKRSSVSSRKDVSTRTQLSRHISLNIPIVSSNMDTVTEHKMAIALAREGGIGIIHRFMPIKTQVREVQLVKRADNLVIDTPFTISPDMTLRDAKEAMEQHQVSGLLCVDDDSFLMGILTRRDIAFEENLDTVIRTIMTPKERLITGQPDTSLDDARKVLAKHRIEKLPLVDATGKLKGLITAQDIVKRLEHPLASRDEKGRLLVGAAVGVKEDFLERAEALVRAGCDVLVVDIAHGHSDLAIATVKELKKRFTVDIIAGNVATADGTRDLIEAGADAIKVGVGGGCFAAGTRILMANGLYKNIEEVRPSDRVINMEGKPVTVLRSFCTGIKTVHSIRSSLFYEETYVTPDHQYWIGDLNTNSVETMQSRGYASLLQVQSKTVPKVSKYKWKQIQDLKQDVLLMPRNMSFELPDSFEIQLKKRKSGNHKTLQYEVDTILKPTYDLGYIFGTFLGDGSAHTAIINDNSHIGSVRWYFGKHEQHKVEKLTRCISSMFGKQCKIYERKNIFIVILYYKPFAEFLQRFGKRQNKNLPAEFLSHNKEYLRGILDGLIDSDGNIEPEGRVLFHNTSRYLIELFTILTYLLTGVFPNNGKKARRVGGLNTVMENLHQSYVASILNTGAKRLTKDYQAIKLLEKQETSIYTEVYDLEVACPTHSFIANNAIVHNSICITRVVTGSGVPQLQAILDCAQAAKQANIPIIADGGIKTSGDITKALAAGAQNVMLGSLLAGTDESPGVTIIRNGIKQKVCRGMASFGAQLGRNEREGKKDEPNDYVPEGVEAMVPYRGKVAEVIHQLIGGLRSGMSYCGAQTLEEMQEKAQFIKMSAAGLRESHPHDVNVVK